MHTQPHTRITNCRFCQGPLSIPFCDLGDQPLANSYLKPDGELSKEPRFPLNVRICGTCKLAQLDHIADAHAIFSDYAYFSSVSRSWLEHCAKFVEAAIPRFGLDGHSLVVEIASNDGYLLKNFVAAHIPCLGVEPAANVAAKAIAEGVPTDIAFFGRETADRLVGIHGQADLVIANNVFAHVPDINDFTAGLARILKAEGVVSIEFPHLARLVENVQFDTIYHEHYTYFSLLAASRVLAAHGLRVFDAQRLSTHGGSVRVSACHEAAHHQPTASLAAVRQEEATLGMDAPAYYAGFEPRVRQALADFTQWLGQAKAAGRKVLAYGAAAKGNTFLNAAGITVTDIAFVADSSPAKQGRLLPGSNIPIVTPDQLLSLRPDDVVILPWNIAAEIERQLAEMSAWGGRFVTAIPRLKVWDAKP